MPFSTMRSAISAIWYPRARQFQIITGMDIATTHDDFRVGIDAGVKDRFSLQHHAQKVFQNPAQDALTLFKSAIGWMPGGFSGRFGR